MLDLANKKIILASASPRRKELMAGLDIPFEIRVKESDESFPDSLEKENVAIYLAKKKSDTYIKDLKENEILITSDTTVLKDGIIYNKPNDEVEAISMLKALSGQQHEVITGVCIRSLEKEVSFDSRSIVKFKILEEDEIRYYVRKYKPFDKAGSYGIQEWLGYIAIERIEGSYFTIMGLPVHRIYEELKQFDKK
jgi:septum formation protein